MSATNPTLKYRSLWLLIGYALVAFIVYSSLTSHTIKVDVRFFDKYAHTLAYFVLMGWFMQIYHKKTSIVMCFVLFVLLGEGLEFVQGMTAYRSFDVYDMLANSLGVVLALCLALLSRFSELLSCIEHFFSQVKNVK